MLKNRKNARIGRTPDKNGIYRATTEDTEWSGGFEGYVGDRWHHSKDGHI